MSVGLVRFSWVEENEDDEDIEDVDIKVAPYGTVVTTPVTNSVWVGVLPDTLTGKVAFHSSNDIPNLLKEHGISDVDVAYRESVVMGFSGPELFTPVPVPVSDLDPLKAVIDPVTTALGLPIAGLKTLKSQGTMGFYFRWVRSIPSRPATSCSLKMKAIIHTPTSVRSFPREDEHNFDYTAKPGLRRRSSSWAPKLSPTSSYPSRAISAPKAPRLTS
jgi:hypothetical protein